ncbi:hypothetical protein BDR06DRAFT_982726 [Suillus hirtellus]|nr:hypothetical protein BDR06DRAFT_982726 [Suillus hirtellus]
MYVSVLKGGHLRIPCDLVVDGNLQGEFVSCPSLAFALQHSETKSWVVFNLGIWHDLEGYTPLSQECIKSMGFAPVVNQTVVESLVKGGISPDEVETVIVSHLHWDQISYEPGPPFSLTALPHEHTKFLPLSDFSLLIRPFPLALDFFSDGSMYVIDTPEHVRGHINILVHTSSDGTWILLGGDSAHDYRLITGEKEVVHSIDSSGCIRCMHEDKDKAVENITRIWLLLEILRVQVLIAHNSKWYEENKGSAFLPGNILPLAA